MIVNQITEETQLRMLYSESAGLLLVHSRVCTSLVRQFSLDPACAIFMLVSSYRGDRVLTSTPPTNLSHAAHRCRAPRNQFQRTIAPVLQSSPPAQESVPPATGQPLRSAGTELSWGPLRCAAARDCGIGPASGSSGVRSNSTYLLSTAMIPLFDVALSGIVPS